DAGFVVKPSPLSADGGLGVWHDPSRGVIISWDASADHLVSHATIRAAVLLALRTVLAEAGHRVGEDFNGLELVVTS
ncbi:hypothetical protein ACWEPC_57485, partial [Nonomuraea sp. NPDC004297]